MPPRKYEKKSRGARERNTRRQAEESTSSHGTESREENRPVNIHRVNKSEINIAFIQRVMPKCGELEMMGEMCGLAMDMMKKPADEKIAMLAATMREVKVGTCCAILFTNRWTQSTIGGCNIRYAYGICVEILERNDDGEPVAIKVLTTGMDGSQFHEDIVRINDPVLAAFSYARDAFVEM